MECFNFRHIFLVLFYIQTVSSFPRIYQLCCSDYIPNQLPENARFDDPDILYTEPEITASSDCNKTMVDCTLLDFDSGFYNLIFSDENNNITKVIESTNPIFELDCGIGGNNYISCEHGCDPEKCPPSDMCLACNIASLYTPPKPEDQIVIKTSKEYVNGCLQDTIVCDYTGRVTQWCFVKILLNLEKSGEVLLNERINSGTVKGTLNCNGSAYYEYEGEKVESFYCAHEYCGINKRKKRESTEACSSCEHVTTLFQPRSGENEILPSSYSTKTVDECVESSIKCNLGNSSFCRLKIFGVAENADSNSLHLIGEAIDAEQLIENIKCGGNGKYEHNGKTINSIYCTYEECQ